MAKNVFSKMKLFRPAALVFVSWLTFVLGQIVEPNGLKLILLSAARVLPQVLYSMLFD